MKNWERFYKKEKSFIKTNEPSKIVLKGFEMLNLQPGDCHHILDLGCGNGRNTIYAAQFNISVDAVDLENLNFMQNIPENISNNIIFQKISVMDFNIKPKTYVGIIATRLFQYLKPSEVHLLLGRIRN